ncbi:MAG: hypothetical protein GYA23_07920 [Methanomicrobiales archaeon]|nr:hypothetical protein [Methanomicrobiales archaeon]
MNYREYAWLAAGLIILLAVTAGCTAPSAPPATPVPTPTTAPVAPGTTAAPAAPIKSAEIDTVISVHYDDFACLDVQKELGKAYLYPDEKYSLSASSPGVSGVNVNVLFLDENDSLGIRQINPQWDSVQKKWVYEGIVPVVQFNDITVPVEKTFTIKSQSKYYICVDDRKETGINDVMLRVPVKLKRL